MNARDALLSCLSGTVWPHGPLLEALRLPPDADVLDLGCGDGDLLTRLWAAGHQGRLVGLDVQAQPAQPGVAFLVGSAHDLPFPDATFDVVLLVRVLAHLDQPQLALHEARRVLKPGGQLVVASQPPEHLQRFWQLWPSEASELRPPDEHNWMRLDIRVPVRFEHLDDVHKLAQSYGLTLTEALSRPLNDRLALTVLQQAVWLRDRALDAPARSVKS